MDKLCKQRMIRSQLNQQCSSTDIRALREVGNCSMPRLRSRKLSMARLDRRGSLCLEALEEAC